MLAKWREGDLEETVAARRASYLKAREVVRKVVVQTQKDWDKCKKFGMKKAVYATGFEERCGGLGDGKWNRLYNARKRADEQEKAHCLSEDDEDDDGDGP